MTGCMLWLCALIAFVVGQTTVIPLPNGVELTAVPVKTRGAGTAARAQWSLEVGGVALHPVKTAGKNRGIELAIVSGLPSSSHTQQQVLVEQSVYDTLRSPAQDLALLQRLQSLAPGDLVVLNVLDTGADKLSQETRDILEKEFGSKLISKARQRSGWALIANKGLGECVAESVSEPDKATELLSERVVVPQVGFNDDEINALRLAVSRLEARTATLEEAKESAEQRVARLEEGTRNLVQWIETVNSVLESAKWLASLWETMSKLQATLVTVACAVVGFMGCRLACPCGKARSQPGEAGQQQKSHAQ